MKPVGILMWEHRLIERVIGLFPGLIAGIGQTNRVDTAFIQTAVDFIRTYADRTHHGKEEDILFKKLENKDMLPEHRKIMVELINEHIQARDMVKKLVAATERYLEGQDTVEEITAHLKSLALFYPEHIRKEDKDFFFQSMDYFSKEELDEMMREFQEFDRRMVHEKYKAVAEKLMGKPIEWSPPGMVG
ncbi:MAG: hemerythrin domain-containing protein [Desulfomonilia bacterium]|jgi:hemerythrin-like domain-containing protein|uniref:Hemerythrin-like domain-containing protein n=1 Tax=anaerobic digester metagenome TaxID=1263854 RepID=A0A485LZM3_9ZZZZ|nr:hemerythrin domain-containing protein [Pseudomonadota bacterium]HON39202.1 hemerythrin domain-containing protein [Deltaproteobacteria bacterium]HPD22446.1 hemerythrin domain-containing protein [Deltaproteobacteria bacterium]HRS55125.1 hemerythrin domain-containing protein [Desulfomonilia bacterium]HRV34744.1 hemerythrin domain-containing protein [Desulfomonilia bacterium]